jgi:hypothetical protein
LTSRWLLLQKLQRSTSPLLPFFDMLVWILLSEVDQFFYG